MTTFALGIWIATLVGGAYLWSFTTGAHREESNARATRLPPSLLFVHPLLALLGLALWLLFMYTDEPAYAWLAFADLLVGSAIGSFLAHRTLKDWPRGAPAPPAGAAGTPSTPAEEAAADVRRMEHQMPLPAILLHGVLALGTVLAVLVAALQA